MGKLLKSVKLDFDLSLFLKNEHTEEWPVVEYYQEKEGVKLPETFNSYNTKINQVFWNKQDVDYNSIGRSLGMTVETVATIRQRPGQILPWHHDHFHRLIKDNPNIDKLRIVRANIFLEDWKSGHVLQVEHKIIPTWQKGEGFMWSSGIYHLSGNLGLEDKYTLQVSGILLD